MGCEHCGASLEAGVMLCTTCGREQHGPSGPRRAAVEEAAPEASASFCPLHPAMPIAGACPRCGNFVCIRCAPGAANDVLTCAACLARTDAVIEVDKSAFGGPLVLPLLGLNLNLLGSVALALYIPATRRLSDLDALQLVLFASTVITVIASVTGLVGFVKRKRWLPALMIALYLADVAIGTQVDHNAVFGWALWCIGWAGYFALSDRVKRTFTA